jgi:hypothetical protein
MLPSRVYILLRSFCRLHALFVAVLTYGVREEVMA